MLTATDYAMISCCVGAAVAIGSLITYCRFGKRLKEQQIQLNGLALGKAIRDTEKETTADITARFKRNPSRIEIENVGAVCADDVQVRIDPDIRCMPRQFPFPMNVESHQVVPISVTASIGGPQEVTVKIWWSESNRPGKNSSREIPISLFS